MLVLDANILMRAVLVKRTRTILAKYGDHVEFVAPDVAFGEALAGMPHLDRGHRFLRVRRRDVNDRQSVTVPVSAVVSPLDPASAAKRLARAGAGCLVST